MLDFEHSGSEQERYLMVCIANKESSQSSLRVACNRDQWHLHNVIRRKAEEWQHGWSPGLGGILGQVVSTQPFPRLSDSRLPLPLYRNLNMNITSSDEPSLSSQIQVRSTITSSIVYYFIFFISPFVTWYYLFVYLLFSSFLEYDIVRKELGKSSS